MTDYNQTWNTVNKKRINSLEKVLCALGFFAGAMFITFVITAI